MKPSVALTGLRPARGFTLIEVLVALIITGVGLLGLAKLQALVYANTNTSSERSLAALQASGMVSAMRANRAYWSQFVPPLNVTVTETAVTADEATLAAGLTTVAGSLTYCNVGGNGTLPCPSNVLAAHDLLNWAASLSALLPGAQASIRCLLPPPPANPPALPTECTIQVTWIEHTAALNKQSQGTAMAPPTYSLNVVP